MRARFLLLLLMAVGGLFFWLGRQSLPELRERLASPTPREEYARRLRSAGLGDAALGRLWERAARRALDEAPTVVAPFEETGYLDAARPGAVGYRFRIRRGERVRFEVGLQPASNALLFLDLFRVPTDTLRGPVHVTSADSASRSVVFEPDRDGEYLVRIQPELLRGGRYTLTAVIEPTMAFPVSGGGNEDVQSFFGDPRDGGSRAHHGIDIFADRGTPVVAAVAGRVRSVRTTPLGGRVVWLRDERTGQSLYYAHLEEQHVERGAVVRPGDTLGLVGNSGNARSTPPHLHFGIYRRGAGPVDPYPFVRPRSSTPPPPSIPRGEVGGTRRVTDTTTALRAAPDAAAPEVGRLDRDVPVRVAGVAGAWLRVEVADGRRGFIAGRSTGPVSSLGAVAVERDAPLRDRPVEPSAELARLAAGDSVEILGRLGDHLWVRAQSREAWLPMAANR